MSDLKKKKKANTHTKLHPSRWGVIMQNHTNRPHMQRGGAAEWLTWPDPCRDPSAWPTSWSTRWLRPAPGPRCCRRRPWGRNPCPGRTDWRGRPRWPASVSKITFKIQDNGCRGRYTRHCEMERPRAVPWSSAWAGPPAGCSPLDWNTAGTPQRPARIRQVKQGNCYEAPCWDQFTRFAFAH